MMSNRNMSRSDNNNSKEMEITVARHKHNGVDEPAHYQHGTFEVIDEMLLVFGPQKTYDFCILNAWKYRNRAPYKGNTEQDMEKADRYMQMAKQIMDNNLDAIHEVGLIKGGN